VKVATIGIRTLVDYSVGLKDCQQPAAGTTQDPIEGTQHPQALYLSLSQEVFITPPPPRVGWHLAIQVLPIGTTWEQCMKSLGPDLCQGATTPVWSYGEVHFPMMALTHLR
jgi:hypothetical protein